MTPAEPPRRGRGTELLLLHCALLREPVVRRGPALERLEGAVGTDFARLLVAALAGDKGRGSFRIPAEAC